MDSISHAGKPAMVVALSVSGLKLEDCLNISYCWRASPFTAMFPVGKFSTNMSTYGN